jgi:hypothetical protein
MTASIIPAAAIRFAGYALRDRWSGSDGFFSEMAGTKSHRRDAGLQSRAKPKPNMPENNADRYRRQAEVCEELAARTNSEMERDAWLRLAADWLKLADEAEKRNSE